MDTPTTIDFNQFFAMFKQFSLCALLLVCASFPGFGQQAVLVEGQPANVLIDSLTYFSNAECPPDFDFELWPDSAFLPFATGVRLYAVVTDLSLQFPNSLSSSYGSVAVGDTLPFDTTRSYPFTFWSPGYVSIEFRAIGTPLVGGEVYPCGHELALTLAWCTNVAYLWPDSPPSTCQVQPMNSVAEALSGGWKLFPVPAAGRFQVRNADGISLWTAIDLLDLNGRRLRHWGEGEDLDASGLAPGMYLLALESASGRAVLRFLVD